MIGITTAGFSFNFYYVREMAASMLAFSLLFFSFSLILLTAHLLWYTGKRVASWSRPVPATPVVNLSACPVVLPAKP
jgi:tellurite resistance protein TehA-like permease